MKVLVEDEMTVKELREKLQSEPAIIIHDDVPVMAALPIEDHKRPLWAEQLMNLVRHLVGSPIQASNLVSDQDEENPLKADPGMVEVSLAIAGVAAAVAAFLPGITSIPSELRVVAAILCSAVACLSVYSALWLLACYCCQKKIKESVPLGIKEIHKLATSPEEFGPYWVIALGLLFLSFLAVLLGVLAVIR